MSLALRVRGGAQSRVTDRLRAIATALDPTLRLGPILTLDEVLREDQGTMRLLALAIALATLSVLLLSAAGIYALMSFTVARRRREIGIRAALGAHPRRLLASIFFPGAGPARRRSRRGAPGSSALLDGATGGELLGGEGAILLPGVSALMMVVGLVAGVPDPLAGVFGSSLPRRCERNRRCVIGTALAQSKAVIGAGSRRCAPTGRVPGRVGGCASPGRAGVDHSPVDISGVVLISGVKALGH